MNKAVPHSAIRLSIGCLLGSFLATSALAQELVPRRWSHLPLGTNAVGAAYAHTSADIFVDPVLKLEDVEMALHSYVLSYIHSFECFGKSARIDLKHGYQEGNWKGILDGSPASTSRSGWSDPVARVAINLMGAPPLEGKEFADYRASLDSETIIGAGLAVQLPLGDYHDDKLINLGSNQFTFRPQLGVVHERDRWSFELTGSIWLFTDNDDFYGDTKREQDPLYTIQGHVVHTFKPGLWLAASLGYGHGGASTVDGDAKSDGKRNLAWALAGGYSITKQFGLQVGYVGMRTQRDLGLDSDTFLVALSYVW